MSHTAPPPSLQEETEILDTDWLAAPSRRSRTRLLLFGALVVLLTFLTGVQVQKHWGADSGSSSSAAPSGSPASGAFGAFPAGGPSGTASSSTSDGSTGTNGSTDPTKSATPAVIGTVSAVHGHVWTVKDLGGHSQTVKITGTTTLTRPMADRSAPVHTGAHVTVLGKTRGHTVTATAITLR